MYRWILFWLVLLGAVHVRSEVVEGLYAATVPVADQSAESLETGASAALGEVIIKVSGSESAQQVPAIAAALKQARSQVQQFVFSQAPGPEGGLAAKFQFDSEYVTDLITGAGLPLWTANRPRVLAWIAVESGGERYYVNPAETPELAEQLSRAFESRGVPLRFPLFDLGDSTTISLGDVWALDGERALAASARYSAEEILLGRAVEAASGRWAGDWSYLSQEERVDRSGDASDAGEFFQRGAGLVAETMVARYAVTPGNTPGGQLTLGVSSVESFADYAAIVNWLENLELVQQVSLQQVDGDRVEFNVLASLDAARLAQLLQLNRRLQPLNPDLPDLEYQWMN